MMGKEKGGYSPSEAVLLDSNQGGGDRYIIKLLILPQVDLFHLGRTSGTLIPLALALPTPGG